MAEQEWGLLGCFCLLRVIGVREDSHHRAAEDRCLLQDLNEAL